jgi:hypothetical protein
VAAGRIIFDLEESGLLESDRVVVSQIVSPREGMQLVEAGS